MAITGTIPIPVMLLLAVVGALALGAAAEPVIESRNGNIAFSFDSSDAELLVSWPINNSSSTQQAAVITSDVLQTALEAVVANFTVQTTLLSAALAQERTRFSTALSQESTLLSTAAVQQATVLSTAIVEQTAALSAALVRETTALSTALAGETSRATAAEEQIRALLTTSVQSEASRAIAEDNSLNDAVLRERSLAGVIQTSINSSVIAETVRAVAAEASLFVGLGVETSRAQLAETALSQSIANTNSRAIVVDSSLADSVLAEQSRAIVAERAVSAGVATELSRALAAEGAVQLSVWQEASRTVGVDNTLSTAVATERSRALSLEQSLGVSIANEVTRALLAEASVQLSVFQEASRAIGFENVLSAAISSDRSRAIAAEASVLAVAQGEIVRATAAEASLANRLVLGTAANPAVSCNEILQRSFGPSGVYWIRPVPASPVFQVFCDMETDGGGWTMVYKLTAGSTTNPAPNTLWTNPPTNEGSTVPLSVRATPTVGVYTNRIITSYWNANGFTFANARVHVYSQGELRKFFRFDASNTVNTGWFNFARLQSSSYTDITAGNQNFFSIDGDIGSGRFWFINRQYGGCPSDVGWLSVGPGTGCPWEQVVGAKPVIYFAPGTTAVAWQTNSVGGLNAGIGDVFAVFVR